ncbi:WXG100 family type VII secretion target [Kitasatospora sp. NPDC127111]|uniref:WXG100 family type VII secretion target n=1 Tax=Kitasatospora sp. NPDC127111 TaxID=3345363 RepID=UPI003635F12A
MADIELRHESIDQAVSDLQQAGSTMESNMDQLVGTLKGVIDGGHFAGAAATAFQEFFRVVNQNEADMRTDIRTAASLLGQMHATMKHADATASKAF